MPNFITNKPVSDITNTVSSEFGERVPPVPGASSEHKGIDFAVPIGTAVYAAHKGIVARKDPNDPNGGGKVIFLRTADKNTGNVYETRYLHLSKFWTTIDKNTGEEREIRELDEIEGGAQIALSGNTGSASKGPHLHFTVVVNGQKQNPREYLARAFPDEFSKVVKSGNYGIDLEGDQNDNTLISNSRSNKMIGKEGLDTYYFPTLSGSDVIDDTDANGRIVIGNGKQSVLLSGNALPKTDSNNNKIEGVWSLSGFDLHKVGSDLVIVKSGDDVSKEKIGKVSVKNFPFSNEKGGFQITLGKKMDKNAGVETYVRLLSDSILFGAASCSSKSGQFMAMQYSAVNSLESASFKIFNYAGEEVRSNSLTDLFADYQNQGNGNVTPDPQATTSRPAHGPYAYNIGGAKYLAYNVMGYQRIGRFSYSQTGLLLVDENGNPLKSKVYRGAIWDNNAGGESVSPFGLGISENQDLFFLYRLESGSNFNSNIEIVVQKINPTTLEEIGETISYSGAGWGAVGFSQYGGTSNFLPISNSDFTFDNGAQVIVDMYSAQHGATITSIIPKLRDLTPSEIIPNQDLGSGEQVTNPNLKKQILSFAPEVRTNLTISSNPNSVVALFGRGDNHLSQMSFPVNHHSQIEIHSATNGDYTIDQLLNGEFDFAASSPLKISKPVTKRYLSAKQEDQILSDPRSNSDLVQDIWERRLGGEKEVQKLMNDAEKAGRIFDLESFGENKTNNTASSNSTDDDYQYYYGDGSDDVADAEEINLTEAKYPFTIIKLNLTETESQTVILSGVNATEVAKMPEAYFLTQLQLSRSPTSNPSQNPTSQPSHHPTAGDLIMPTGNPTGIPSGIPSGQPSSQPTGVPSRVPFANPSAIPSYIPSEIPSYKPSGQPSGQPSSKPSNQPSSQPSSDPSNQPSANPTENPSYHPTAGDLIMPTGNPTGIPSGIPSGQPSSQPTGVPSRVPFANPSAIPSYIPSEIPSYKPSGQPSGQPSSQPSLNRGKPTTIPTEFIRSPEPTSAQSFETNQPTNFLPDPKNNGGDNRLNLKNLNTGETAGLGAAALVVGTMFVGLLRWIDKSLRGSKSVSNPSNDNDIESSVSDLDKSGIVVGVEEFAAIEFSENRSSSRSDSSDSSSPSSSVKGRKQYQQVAKQEENSIRI